MQTKNVLKGGVWKSVEQRSSQMLEYIDTCNQTDGRQVKKPALFESAVSPK
jgi:hypothetical protein